MTVQEESRPRSILQLWRRDNGFGVPHGKSGRQTLGRARARTGVGAGATDIGRVVIPQGKGDGARTGAATGAAEPWSGEGSDRAGGGAAKGAVGGSRRVAEAAKVRAGIGRVDEGRRGGAAEVV